MDIKRIGKDIIIDLSPYRKHKGAVAKFNFAQPLLSMFLNRKTANLMSQATLQIILETNTY